MDVEKTIALVAHDNRKQDLLDWVEHNHEALLEHRLVCTGTTGQLVQQALQERLVAAGRDAAALAIQRLKSGPLGGDQQLGAMIAEGRVDLIIFFWDPMQPHPHDVDVKALLRIAVVYNIPLACNRSTADFMISSPLLREDYQPAQKDYQRYLDRSISPVAGQELQASPGERRPRSGGPLQPRVIAMRAAPAPSRRADGSQGWGSAVNFWRFRTELLPSVSWCSRR